jgi:hypothetical protein
MTGAESSVLSSTPLGSGDTRSVTTVLAGTAPLVAAAGLSTFGTALTAGISVFLCSIAMLPSAMVIETPSASTRMLTTLLLLIVSPWFGRVKLGPSFGQIRYRLCLGYCRIWDGLTLWELNFECSLQSRLRA